MADGSPASGYESFSLVESCFHDGVCVWRLLPMTYLGVGHMSMKQNMFALLWALLLECGPSEDMLRFRLSKIRSDTTDRGLESHMCDVEDLLPTFLSVLTGKPPVRAERFLSPRPYGSQGGTTCSTV